MAKETLQKYMDELVSFSGLSWEILRPDTREVLCRFLNEEHIFTTKNKVKRDYRGLIQLIKINNDAIVPQLRDASNPTERFFTFMSKNRIQLSIGNLIDNLNRMDRQDVIEKLFAKRPNASQPMMLEDCNFAQHPNNVIIMCSGDQDAIEFSTDLAERSKACNLQPYIYQKKMKEEPFREVKDKVIAYDMVIHDVQSMLLNDRCKSVIVIYTPTFSSSDAYAFLKEELYKKFSCYDGNRCLDGKIVPVIYRECEITDVDFKFLGAIKYQLDGECNFYERLLCTTFGVNKEELTQDLTEYRFLGDSHLGVTTPPEVT